MCKSIIKNSYIWCLQREGRNELQPACIGVAVATVDDSAVFIVKIAEVKVGALGVGVVGGGGKGCLVTDTERGND